MLETSFNRLTGCRVPIQIAPMGAISTPALIRATTEAGAFGMVGTAGMSADQVETMLDAVVGQAAGPIGVNVLLPFLDIAVVEAVGGRVDLVDFYHGAVDADLVSRVHDAGALASWHVGSVEDARRAVDAGCDLLAVRGVEGGGRMHGDQPLVPLLDGVLDAVDQQDVDVPVLAAGGLATGRDLAAVLAMGAAGARMGTRFVATIESGAHDRYKQAIVNASADATVLITDFSVLWPEGPAPHRVLRRSLEAANAHDDDTVGEVEAFGERRALPKFAAIPPTAGASGNIEAFAMYAGTSAGSIRAIEPAGDVVRRIVAEAEARLAATEALRR